MNKVCEDFEAELIEFDGERDHVHLLVNYPPKTSISRLVNSLRGVERKEYPKRRRYIVLLRGKPEGAQLFYVRLISDSGRASVYVPNMPDDETECGRLRDNIRVLVNGANTHASNLNLQSCMTGIAKKMKDKLINFERKFKAHSSEAIASVDLMHHKTEVAFMNLGLTEEQEAYFTSVMEESTKKLTELMLDGTNLDIEMETIVDEMINVASNSG